MNRQDTIAALATPVGVAAIGVIRLSGSQAISIAQRLFYPYRRDKSLPQLPGFTGLLGRLRDKDQEIDEVIATVYHAPKSYTGEDCVEFSCHGSPYILDRVLELCVSAGARPAQAGEFTKRAFLNGKLELSQAEGVCDLIHAQSESGRRAALAGRDGVLSVAIGGLVETLRGLSAHLAAWADYPEEDLAPVDVGELSGTLDSCLASMTDLLETYGKSRLLREGISTAIVGKPNVGKSTLMNLLAGHQRSIVTNIPGTTRDIVQETVRIGDYMLRLLDTAGIRDTLDVVEREGVQLARQQIESAQLVLAVFDSSSRLDESDRELLSLLKEAPCIAVVNKTDLPKQLELGEVGAQLPNLVLLSADTGAGKEDLEREIVRLLGLDTVDPAAAMIANARQNYSLHLAVAALEQAQHAISISMTLDAVNVCIDEALDHLLELTGQRATDKVVEEVFARFCVGK